MKQQEANVRDNNYKVKKLVTLAMLAAISYAITALVHFPLTPDATYLSYDPKDIILAMIGFMFGPLEVLGVTVVVSVLELFTISSTGYIGLIMNILSSCAFAMTAAVVYKKLHTMKGAVLGLVIGMFGMTGVMLLWNYLITPLYTGMPRDVIAGMLLPVFAPFNLIKSGINATLTMLVYKPVVRALRKAGLLKEREEQQTSKKEIGVIMALSAFLFVTLVIIVLVQFKIIG